MKDRSNSIPIRYLHVLYISLNDSNFFIRHLIMDIFDKFDWKNLHKTRNVLKTRLNFKEFYFYIFSFFQINIKKKYSIKIKIHFYSIIFIPVPFENNLSYCPYRIFPQFFRMHFILFLHSFHLRKFLFFLNQSTVQIKNYTCISNSYTRYYKYYCNFLISILITRLYYNYFQQNTIRYLKF